MYFTRSKLLPSSPPTPITSWKAVNRKKGDRSHAKKVVGSSLAPEETTSTRFRRITSRQINYCELSSSSSSSSSASHPTSSTSGSSVGLTGQTTYVPSKQDDDLDEDDYGRDDESSSTLSKTPSDLSEDEEEKSLSSSTSTASFRSFESGKATNNDDMSDTPSSPFGDHTWDLLEEERKLRAGHQNQDQDQEGDNSAQSDALVEVVGNMDVEEGVVAIDLPSSSLSSLSLDEDGSSIILSPNSEKKQRGDAQEQILVIQTFKASSSPINIPPAATADRLSTSASSRPLNWTQLVSDATIGGEEDVQIAFGPRAGTAITHTNAEQNSELRTNLASKYNPADEVTWRTAEREYPPVRGSEGNSLRLSIASSNPISPTNAPTNKSARKNLARRAAKKGQAASGARRASEASQNDPSSPLIGLTGANQESLGGSDFSFAATSYRRTIQGHSTATTDTGESGDLLSWLAGLALSPDPSSFEILASVASLAPRLPVPPRMAEDTRKRSPENGLPLVESEPIATVTKGRVRIAEERNTTFVIPRVDESSSDSASSRPIMSEQDAAMILLQMKYDRRGV
ncbi:hypothetical protein IAT40_004354 [Kwoniella sp. CBS 6097]